MRWRIERFFHTLEVGIRIEDRRLEVAEDLRQRLAFDPITAFRVYGNQTVMGTVNPKCLS